jgi:mannose-6-phosphate isomerase-like protein (cupin superfamily)
MGTRITSTDARQQALAAGDYAVLLEHGSLEIGYYIPDRVDGQTPHEQDEVYLVHKGHGYFVMDDRTEPVVAGDALFIPAGQVHRFENFSADFAAWVIFYGPRGGESE